MENTTLADQSNKEKGLRGPGSVAGVYRELDAVEDNYEKLIGTVQQRCGEDREVARRVVNDYLLRRGADRMWRVYAV